MLVKLGCLWQEGQQIFPRVVFVICDRAADRPEIDVYVEEIHIDGNLYALSLEKFWFHSLLHYHHFPVGYGGDHVFAFNVASARHTEEIEDEAHKEYEQSCERRPDINGLYEEHHSAYYNDADQPYPGYGEKTVTMDFHCSISLKQIY